MKSLIIKTCEKGQLEVLTQQAMQADEDKVGRTMQVPACGLRGEGWNRDGEPKQLRSWIACPGAQAPKRLNHHLAPGYLGLCLV